MTGLESSVKGYELFLIFQKSKYNKQNTGARGNYSTTPSQRNQTKQEIAAILDWERNIS